MIGAAQETAVSPRTCAHDPEAGSIYTRSGIPVKKIAHAPSWPLEATCRNCRQSIRCNEPDGTWGLKYPETES